VIRLEILVLGSLAYALCFTTGRISWVTERIHRVSHALIDRAEMLLNVARGLMDELRDSD
jgi:hypothetical protein